MKTTALLAAAALFAALACGGEKPSPQPLDNHMNEAGTGGTDPIDEPTGDAGTGGTSGNAGSDAGGAAGEGGTDSGGAAGTENSAGTGGTDAGGAGGTENTAGTGGTDAGGTGGTDGDPDPIVDLISDERPFEANQAIDVQPVHVTSVTDFGANVLITVQDSGGGEDSGMVALVPDAFSVEVGDCIHLTGEFNLSANLLSTTALETVPCFGEAPSFVNLDRGQSLSDNLELDGQLVRYEGRLNSGNQTGIVWFITNPTNDEYYDVRQPQGIPFTLRVMRGHGDLSLLESSSGVDGTILSGLYIANYPDLGPVLLATGVEPGGML